MRLHRVLKALAVVLISLLLNNILLFHKGHASPVINECFRPKSVQVVGHSMHPIIRDGQKVTVLFGFYQCNPICRGDIVLLEAGGRFYVKSVRALPGDRFHLERDSAVYFLYVNGLRAATSLGVPYTLSEAKARMLLLYEKDCKGVIPQDAYLVLGNQLEGSIDATQYGLVGKENIKGKVILSQIEAGRYY